MKSVTLILVLIGIISCSEKRKCGFRTATDLEGLDSACIHIPGQDSFAFYLRNFSLRYNDFRKSTGIPALAPDFEAELYTVNNQVNWHGDIKDGKFIKIDKPYMKWKRLEWNKDTLKYDLSLFIEGKNDRYGKTLNVVYYLDTIGGSNNYLFRYEYSPGQDSSSLLLNKVQADSILKEWKISL